MDSTGNVTSLFTDPANPTGPQISEDVYLGKTAAGATTLISADAAKSQQSTNDPLKALDDAIAQVDKFRSSLGAIQNRLDSAVTNLNNTTTNLSEAQSRIQDADYATEVSNMSKAQIVQQAGNSVLAKANQFLSRFCLCCKANRLIKLKPRFGGVFLSAFTRNPQITPHFTHYSPD